MKQIKRHSRKPLIVTICIVAVLLIASGILWFSKARYGTEGNTSQKGTTTKSTSIPDASTGASTPTTDTSSNSNDSSVVVKPVDNPGANDPYPIVNEHYKIEQISSTSYSITLYAISNSPSQYEQYVAQQKQFKQEALAYLTGRYGDITKFSFTWSPPSAGSL